MVVIVKRRGHKEKFDERKVYGSVYAACASAHYGEKECEKVSEEMTKKIKKMVASKERIDSTLIRNRIKAELKKKDGELAFYYEQHLPNLKKL